MSFSIDLDKSPAENMKHLMQERVDNCRAYLQDVAHPHTAIHQARKEFKKLRALCRLVRKEVGENAYTIANYYFRDIARKLSDARDATALLDTLYDLEKKVTTTKQQALLKEIKHHLGAKKAALTRIQINRHQLLQEVYADLQNAEKHFCSWTFKHNDFLAYKPSLGKVYRQCRKGLKNAYAESTPAAFHEWRKQVKYLRYQVDIFTPVWPEIMSALENELHTLSDYLGDDHDLVVFREKTEQITMDTTREMETLLQHLEGMSSKLRQQAFPLGNKLFHLKPSSFTAWMETCWYHARTVPKDEEVRLAAP